MSNVAYSSNYPPINNSMVEAQAVIISKLNNQLKRLQEDNHDLKQEIHRIQADAAMYRTVIEFVQEHPMLQSIWDELVTAMRLIDPERFK